MSEEKDDNIKINIPLFTNLELEEFDFKLDNYLDSIVQEVSKAVFRDKENILLQKVIQKLQKELEQEKEKNKRIKDGILIVGRRNGKSQELNLILEDYISKDKIRALIEEIKNTYYYNEGYATAVEQVFILEELLEE